MTIILAKCSNSKCSIFEKLHMWLWTATRSTNEKTPVKTILISWAVVAAQWPWLSFLKKAFKYKNTLL